MLASTHNPARRKRKRSGLNWQNVILLMMMLMVVIYVRVYLLILQASNSKKQEPRAPLIEARNLGKKSKLILQNHNFEDQAESLLKTPKHEQYSYWRTLAVNLAGKLPEDILRILKSEDPFGVRTFEQRLLEAESSRGRFLQLEELRELFPCPTDRISLPDQRNSDKARAFRNGTEPYFLFFQHLRKAGGTNFCALAENNLEKKNLPSYYCSKCAFFAMSVFVCKKLCSSET